MSSTDNIVKSFNIGFFSTNVDSGDFIKNQIDQFDEPADFSATLKEVSREAYTPSFSKHVQLDGFTLDENNNQIPTKITLKGVYGPELFLDENGNWDKEAEAEAYKKRELEYKKEVIEDWLKNIDFELQSKATLMKALLAKES